MLRNIPLATVFYEIHFDCPYTQLNATFIRTKVKDDRLGRLIKSPIFVVQKAAAPNNGVEFHQKSIDVIRYCLDTLNDDVRWREMLPGGRWCLHGDIVKGFGTGQADHYM